MREFKRLIWDIEVSQNIVMCWKTGYKINIPPENILLESGIICIAYKWEGEREVYSLKWDKNQSDKTLCKKFLKVLEKADEHVGHNIIKYDLKYFFGRCLQHKLPPISPPKSVDTLVIARRHFRLNSNKLDYVAQILGLGNKTRADYAWWKQILIDKCSVAMEKMIKYNKRDVRLSEKVYHALMLYDKVKTHVGVTAGRDKWSCCGCGSEEVFKNATKVTPAGTKQHSMGCHKCGRYYDISPKVYRDYREYKYNTNPTKSSARMYLEAGGKIDNIRDEHR